MKTHYPATAVERLCRLFGKTRQAYYDHYWRQSDDQLQEALMVQLVRSIRPETAQTRCQKVVAVAGGGL